MRRLLYFVIILGLLGGAWWFFDYQDHFGHSIQQYVENGELVTLEARYTPEKIIELHRKELLLTKQHGFRDTSIRLHPYLMLEVKYTQPDKKSREGVLLWSLVDGELVLNADTWEKTHGFEDAINADASKADFQLLNALARSKGTSTIDQLQKELRIDKEALQTLLNNASAKHLIVQKGNGVQLHFHNPKFTTIPETKMSTDLVSKAYENAIRISKKYTKNQIQKIAKAAFGDDFKIRSIMDVSIPIYSIEILNPDGSVRTTLWNALNGEIIQPYYKR